MTIDEAIAQAERIAEGQEKSAELSPCDHAKERISKSAAEHRQLAAWLRELKELRLTVGMIKVEDLKSALTLLREYKADNNELREQIERLDSENYKLTEKLEEIGTAFNEQVSLVGWYEERVKDLIAELEKVTKQEKEYKRLLKSAANVLKTFIPCDDDYCSECIKQGQNCEYDDSFKWLYAGEAEKLIGEEP